MSTFQSFARQDEFSTRQINIDIGSVINNDLAEARRQSQFMAKNAQLQEKWNSMYLDAMVGKHNAEARNRRDNFKLFMDNREKINEQIKYNNEVKLKDAGRDKFVPSMEHILGPALLELAVDVGSAAIKKKFADHNEAQAKEKAKEKSEALSAGADFHASASPEQRKALPNFLEEHAKANAEGKIKLREEFNLLGDYEMSEISSAALHRFNKMDQIERMQTRFSERNVANGYSDSIKNHTAHINGRDITYAQFVALPFSEATSEAWLDSAEQEYKETSGLDAEGIPSSHQTFGIVKRQIEGELLGKVHNQKVKDALRVHKESMAHRLDRAIETNTPSAVIDILFNPDNPQSIAAEFGHPYAVDFFKKQIEKGVFSSSFLRKIYNTPFGPSGSSINEDIRKRNDRGISYERLMAIQVNNEQQRHQNWQNKQNLDINNIVAQVEQWDENNDQHRQESRYMLDSMNNPNSNFYKSTINMPSADKSRFIGILQRKAGVVPTQKSAFPHFDLATKLISADQVTWGVETTIVDLLNETGQTKSTWKKKNLSQAKALYRRWLAQVIKDTGFTNKEALENYVSLAISDDDNEHYKKLKKRLAIKTTEDGTPDGTPLEEPVFTFIEKHGIGALPKATGVSQYQALVDESYGPPSDLVRMYRNPEINSAMIPLLRKLEYAKLNNLGDSAIQDILSNHSTPFVTQRTQHGYTVGMIVNEAIKHGNYKEQGMDFTPLAEHMFLNAQETQELERTIPGYPRMNPGLQSQLQAAATVQSGFTPNAATAHIIGKSGGAVGTPGAGNTTGPHLHIETGDGYTGAGGTIPNYVLNEIYAGDKPLSAYTVTSGIGPRESPGGVGSTNHKGIDLAIPQGTPLTIKPGSNLRVTERDDKTRSGYGYVTVVTDTTTNKTFTLGHLSDVGKQAQQATTTLSAGTEVTVQDLLHFYQEALRVGDDKAAAYWDKQASDLAKKNRGNQ